MQENAILVFDSISLLQINCSNTFRCGLPYGVTVLGCKNKNNVEICKKYFFMQILELRVVFKFKLQKSIRIISQKHKKKFDNII